jgi:hypothetical protein
VPDLHFNRLRGWRVIAEPEALNAVITTGEVLRISPDDAFVIGGSEPVVANDPHAIVTPEMGFDAAELSLDVLTSIADEHIEWPLPGHRPALAQGQIAGVPAKLLLAADGSARLLVACAARHELHGRLA